MILTYRNINVFHIYVCILITDTFDDHSFSLKLREDGLRRLSKFSMFLKEINPIDITIIWGYGGLRKKVMLSVFVPYQTMGISLNFYELSMLSFIETTLYLYLYPKANSIYGQQLSSLSKIIVKYFSILWFGMKISNNRNCTLLFGTLSPWESVFINVLLAFLSFYDPRYYTMIGLESFHGSLLI